MRLNKIIEEIFQQLKSSLSSLIIKGKKISVPIIQGGMGVGVSLHPLASAVAKEGGVGIVSSACLDRIVSKRTGKSIMPTMQPMKRFPWLKPLVDLSA